MTPKKNPEYKPREHANIPELLNYKTLDQYYGLKQSTLAKLVMVGKFVNIVKIGRKNYFRKAQVENWIDAQTVKV